MPYSREIKAIKLLQDRGGEIEATHEEIDLSLSELKRRLSELAGASEILASPEYHAEKDRRLAEEGGSARTPLRDTALEDIYAEAEARYRAPLGLTDILSSDDFLRVNERASAHVRDFDRRYSLDAWDYAIAGGVGLFAAMLDLLCVRAPLAPTVAFTSKVDGIFNKGVQEGLNRLLPPDLSRALSKAFPIGAPDSPVTSALIGGPAKALNPTNHRLRSLAHDPVLGFICGVLDMRNGTCTTVVSGQIVSIPSSKPPVGGDVFQMLGRMLGHLLSDVNAPSLKGNRGMGLPAPFMGLLRMFDNISVNGSTFDKQVEYAFVNGYDFRQFLTASIPVTIMEVLLRAFYIGKQGHLGGVPFGETLMDTMPGQLNPRFRMILAMAYGTFSAVNGGKVYVTQNLLNANYAVWLGLIWNGFHAMKWALLDRNLKVWSEFETREIGELESLTSQLSTLQDRAERLSE